MNELIGFEYCQPKVKLLGKTTVYKLWQGELFVFQLGDIYKLCVKLPVNTFIREGNKNRSINAYDIINEKFYDFYDNDEVTRFYGKIKIKGENIYRKFSSLTIPVLYDVYIKLPNEIVRDNETNNILYLCDGGIYFNPKNLSDENSWELVKEAKAENNCEIEIEINEDWDSDFPF